MDTFKGGNMYTQYSVLGYKIDPHFCDYKSVIEIDERGHRHRSIDYEIKRQKAI